MHVDQEEGKLQAALDKGANQERSMCMRGIMQIAGQEDIFQEL